MCPRPGIGGEDEKAPSVESQDAGQGAADPVPDLLQKAPDLYQDVPQVLGLQRMLSGVGQKSGDGHGEGGMSQFFGISMPTWEAWTLVVLISGVVRLLVKK
jgi:hypothetical protein